MDIIFIAKIIDDFLLIFIIYLLYFLTAAAVGEWLALLTAIKIN